MKSTYLSLLFLCSISFASCLQQECRDCAGFDYEATVFNPDFNDTDLVFRDSAGMEMTFEFLRMVNSPAQQNCSGNTNNPDDIPCVSNAITSFRNSTIGIDMLVGFEEDDRGGANGTGRIAMSFEFKGMESTRFTRTHAFVVEPEVLLVDNFVIALDSVTVGDTLLHDVIDLRQPAAAFSAVGQELPATGRFLNLYFKANEGLLGMRDVEGRTYLRVR